MDVQPQNDHDLLIELRTEMKNIKEVLNDIKNGAITIQTDHENRIRSLEKGFWKIMGASAIVSILIVVVATLIQNFIK